ncbi:MAG: putative transcriptional regulator [Bacteroidia bacterium]|jgi:predicted transcriptional regulator
MKVNTEDINRLMGIFEGRLKKKQNGAAWISNNFGELLRGSTNNEASVHVTKKLYENQNAGQPVRRWKNVNPIVEDMNKSFKRVSEVMETDLFTVHEDDSLDLVVSVMHWQNIRHLPVEKEDHFLVGIINSHTLIHHLASKDQGAKFARDIMSTDFATIKSQQSTAEAIRLMGTTRDDALAVVNEDGNLLGLITESDIIQVLLHTNVLGK